MIFPLKVSSVNVIKSQFPRDLVIFNEKVVNGKLHVLYTVDFRDRKNYYLEFDKYFVNTLNKYASKKAKIFRTNHKSHINKTVHKVIIMRSQLKDKANKTKDRKCYIKYKKKSISVVKLNRQYKMNTLIT